MAAPKKTQISAKEILRDIHSGMANADLKRAYGLSDKGLESLFVKLAAKGLLSSEEAASRSPTRPGPSDSPDKQPATAEWRCPACNVAQSAPVDECPACGVVVAKFRKRQEREQEMPRARAVVPESDSRGWFSIAACAAFLVIAVVGAYVLFMPEKHGAKRGSRVAAVQRPQRPPLVDSGGTKIILNYSTEGFPLGLSASEGFAGHFFETPGADQGYNKMPPDTGARRYYDDLKMAGDTFLIITEASTPPRIFLDANQNGDMTDDPGPFEGEENGFLPNHFTLIVPYLVEKTQAPYRMWLFSSRMGGVRFYPRCHWQGTLRMDDAAYSVVLFDANADGDYSNDPAIIDVDKDGKAAPEETLKPGQSISVAGRLVKLISIAPSGRWVRLEF